MVVNTRPDHDTLDAFRRRFLKEVESLFVPVPVPVQVLMLEMKLLKLGYPY